MTRIRIDPGELRTAVAALRAGRQTMGGIMSRAAAPLPGMPVPLRYRAQDTLARFDSDLTEQRTYMEEEALMLELRAFQAETLDAADLEVALNAGENYGSWADEPQLRERWEPPAPPPPPLDFMGLLHGVLDLAGFVAPPADLLNAAIYALEGNLDEAAVELLAAVPVIGDLDKARRLVLEALEAAQEDLVD